MGFLVAHGMPHPNYVMVADELRDNFSQKGDGHFGGARLICEKGSVPKKISSNQDKKRLY